MPDLTAQNSPLRVERTTAFGALGGEGVRFPVLQVVRVSDGAVLVQARLGDDQMLEAIADTLSASGAPREAEQVRRILYGR